MRGGDGVSSYDKMYQWAKSGEWNMSLGDFEKLIEVMQEMALRCKKEGW